MISIAGLVAELESRGIILFLSGSDIRYRSPKDALTAADREQLRARRDALLPYLQAREAGLALRNIKGIAGPATPSVTQEMWWRFAGGPTEGQPIALNIAMISAFRQVDCATLTEAVRDVVARHETLRSHIRIDGESMTLHFHAAEDFEITVEDCTSLPDAEAAANAQAQAFCAALIPIQGDWLFRARLFILPGGDMLAALCASHVIADAASRNIVLAEIEDVLALKSGRDVPVRIPFVPFNDYSLGERAFLESPQGQALTEHWRQWYMAQPTMYSPQARTPMLWGNGIRQLHNFSIPGRVLEQVRGFAAEIGATPFHVYLTIFSIAMARWSGLEGFPLRILGDKRTSLELARTVGLMFCADAVEIRAPRGGDFNAILRDIRTAYDAAYARRIPTLHFYAPQCVRPGIEPTDSPNKIPAVFNYYSAGTSRERAGSASVTDTTAAMPWPPSITRMPPQSWPRRSSPIFLHLMDVGSQCLASFHFFGDVVNDTEQEAFLSAFFQTFADTIRS